MSNPIIRGFTSLLRFGGRDTADQFWPYALMAVMLVFMLTGPAMSWAMTGVFAEMADFAVNHPEAVTAQASPTSASVAIDLSHPDAPVPDLRRFLLVLVGMCSVAIALLAAAVTRRLHDRNLAGAWAILPLPFLAGGLALLPLMMSEMAGQPEPSLIWFAVMMGNNLLYLAALGWLIVMMALPGSPGPNRYGEVAPTKTAQTAA